MIQHAVCGLGGAFTT